MMKIDEVRIEVKRKSFCLKQQRFSNLASETSAFLMKWLEHKVVQLTLRPRLTATIAEVYERLAMLKHARFALFKSSEDRFTVEVATSPPSPP